MPPAGAQDDLVLVGLRVSVPLLPGKAAEVAGDTLQEFDVPHYEIAIVEAETKTVHGALPLQPQSNGTSFSTSRPLKGLHEPGVCIQIRELGATIPLFSSPPLSELRATATEARAAAEQARADGAATAEELDASAKELAAKAVLGMSGRLAGFEMQPEAGSEPPPEPAKGGKGAKGAAVEEPVVASLSCDWRIQRALPKLGKSLPGKAVPITQRVLADAAAYGGGDRHRTRPLAMRYTSAHDLVQFESRLNGWRTELSDNHKIESGSWPPYAAAAAQSIQSIPSAAPRSTLRGGICEWPPTCWTDEWRAPYIPHHMRGDPLTIRAKEEYIINCEHYRTDLYKQVASVSLTSLREKLPQCVTAEQGVAALTGIRKFLETEVEVRAQGKAHMTRMRNLRQIDAAALLRSVRHLKLPFEYLVRSVWEEGPEVEYDRTKASLDVLLSHEVARRKAAAAKKTKATAASTDLEAPALLERPKTTPGGRLGLLTFHGSSIKPPRTKRPTEA